MSKTTGQDDRAADLEPSPAPTDRPGRRLPPWLKKRLPAGKTLAETTRSVRSAGLATVCEAARCPNHAECWSRRVVTFMIMGRHCTRRCAFCAVDHGAPGPLDPDEPRRVAEAAAELGVRHVVVTSVTRDDLSDEGAGAFARTVEALRARLDSVTVEVLPPDMHARIDCIDRVCAAGPAVFNHNLETVASLAPRIRPQADYARSLEVLRIVKRRHPDIVTKTGLMVGLGETVDEIHAALADARAAGCDVVTIGQYLQPTRTHLPVVRYYRPEEFDALADRARDLGFASVMSGPFVRSSYRAGEAMVDAQCVGGAGSTSVRE
ncbi:MAG: lipoyl synthase [Phycisphaerae bacterium]|nr:lipoyl synthase [Phycisphaerae bacterium]